MSGYIEINTSPAEIRSLGDQIATTGEDLANLATAASGEHGEIVGGEEALNTFGNDDLGKQFKPTYLGTPEVADKAFPATNAGQFFGSMHQIGDELGKLGGGIRAAIDEQMGTELDNLAAIDKIEPNA